VNIGITQRVDKSNTYKEQRDALDQRLVDWVIEAGFIPVPIPNNLVNLSNAEINYSTLEDWLQALNIDAILLSGGNDIGKVLERDLTEHYLLAWADKNRKPVLGICRGMQIMGVYSGGKLIEVNGHVKTHHQLQVVSKNQKFSKYVNSYHSLVLQECPNKFELLAISEDGSIEAIVHKYLPWEAWMWHPEREKKFFKGDLNRFKRLMSGEK
jgi:N5-(cytidine 5'-diphosphoramidyl)-L-glutamine hydrolase